jgi:hypothetical protein
MGFDKLINFISKNLNFDSIEELDIDKEVKKIITNNIMFDISFIIYQILVELEEEINNIIKIILSLPFNFNTSIVQEKIINILNNDHWVDHKFTFDGNNEIEIIDYFKLQLSKTNVINNIVSKKILNLIVYNINKIHCVELIQYINIIFDGIPSYSKILEQRRRRLKNYIESTEKKKKYDETFKNYENTIQSFEDINYDYFKWLKNRFVIDKSFGPISPIITYLEEYLYINLSNKFPNIKIYVNQGKFNGEADYKIFKSIYEKEYEGDICIHTIDSDLVHQIIVQQNYFNLIKKDIKLIVIKYNYKNNHIQCFEAIKIIKNIEKIYIDLYGTFNNKIIFDICLLFYFFGNDHLPSSYEIGPEINLDYYLKIHKKVFNNKETIIDLKNNEILFSFKNFGLYLQEFQKNIEISKTKIMLTRFFKINYNLIQIMTEKLELNFDQIIQLVKKILFDNGKTYKNIDLDTDKNIDLDTDKNIDLDTDKNIDLDTDDIRYKLINKYDNIKIDFKINLNNEEFKDFEKKILEILDKSDCEYPYCGLPLFIKSKYLCEDNYQNIYDIFTENITETLQKNNKYIFDYISIDNIIENYKNNDNEDDLCYFYLKKIYSLIKTLFGNMKNYNCNNYTFYKYYKTPKISSLINYINTQSINFDKELIIESVSSDKYLNSIIHHILITPFIKHIYWKINIFEITDFVNNLDIDNLWYNNQNNFDFKNFDINLFLKLCDFNKKYTLLNNDVYLIEYLQ